MAKIDFRWSWTVCADNRSRSAIGRVGEQRRELGRSRRFEQHGDRGPGAHQRTADDHPAPGRGPHPSRVAPDDRACRATARITDATRPTSAPVKCDRPVSRKTVSAPQVPVLLGGVELELVRTLPGRDVTHLRYRVLAS